MHAQQGSAQALALQDMMASFRLTRSEPQPQSQPGKARPPAHSNHDRSPRAARPQSIPPGRRNAVDDTQFSTF